MRHACRLLTTASIPSSPAPWIAQDRRSTWVPLLGRQARPQAGWSMCAGSIVEQSVLSTGPLPQTSPLSHSGRDPEPSLSLPLMVCVPADAVAVRSVTSASFIAMSVLWPVPRPQLPKDLACPIWNAARIGRVIFRSARLAISE